MQSQPGPTATANPGPSADLPGGQTGGDGGGQPPQKPNKGGEEEKKKKKEKLGKCPRCQNKAHKGACWRVCPHCRHRHHWDNACPSAPPPARNLQRPVQSPAAPTPFYGGGSGSNLSLSEYMMLGLAAQGQAIYRFGGGMGDMGDMGGFGGFGGMGGFGGGGAVATRVLAGGQTVAAAPSKTASKGAKGGGDRVKQGRVSKQPPKAPGDGNSNQPAEGEGRRSRRRKSDKQPGQDGSGLDQGGEKPDPSAMELDQPGKNPKDRSGQDGDDGSDKGPREPVPQKD
ncbi:MAG: hypothetical protein Q9224_006396 [Gallowayella concinna]